MSAEGYGTLKTHAYKEIGLLKRKSLSIFLRRSAAGILYWWHFIQEKVNETIKVCE